MGVEKNLILLIITNDRVTENMLTNVMIGENYGKIFWNRRFSR